MLYTEQETKELFLSASKIEFIFAGVGKDAYTIEQIQKLAETKIPKVITTNKDNSLLRCEIDFMQNGKLYMTYKKQSIFGESDGDMFNMSLLEEEGKEMHYFSESNIFASITKIDGNVKILCFKISL